jgi:FkbM family methyltransferase
MDIIMQPIRKFFKKIPGAIYIYSILYPYLSADNKNAWRVNRWIKHGARFVKKNKLAEITFAHEGVWVKDNFGIEWAYDVNDYNGGIHGIEFGCKHEQKELEIVLSNLKPGFIFFDVGANIGYFAIHAAIAKEDIKIFAFEPVEETYDQLRLNIARNDLQTKIIPVQAAVGNYVGKVMITNNLTTGNHLIFETSQQHKPQIDVVDILTLDSFTIAQKLKRVDFIKCDVEGAEKFVLEGAEYILTTLKPLLVLEVSSSWTKRYGYSTKDIFDTLYGFGYCYSCITQEGLVLSSGNLEADLKTTYNFLFHPIDTV